MYRVTVHDHLLSSVLCVNVFVHVSDVKEKDL